MTTVHLTNSWHERSGGIATFYRALLRASDERGHRMRLIVPGERLAVEEHGRGGRIYQVPAPPAPFNRGYRILYPHHYLLPGGAIRRILRDERPDLVEVCDKYTLPYLGGLLRLNALPGLDLRPAVVGLTCERMDENAAAYLSAASAASAFTRLYLRWLYFPLCDHHIAVSDHTASELRAVSAGHKVDRGVWIRHMGVETAAFSPDLKDASMRRALLQLAGLDGGGDLLLYAGRLVPEKNLGLLAETLERFDSSRTRLLVVGDGTLRGELEGRLAGRARFLGHVADRAQLARIYANCDVFVHPNPREPFGIAPLEAMASGLPLVAPDSGGVTSYAHEGNAWLAPAEPGPFARAVRSALEDAPLRARRIAAALATARERDWSVAAGRYLDLYEDLVARVRGQGSGRLEPVFVSTR